MVSSSLDEKDYEKQPSGSLSHVEEADAEFGGPEARKKLERRLLWKIDLRMSILIIIYILNYVGAPLQRGLRQFY